MNQYQISINHVPKLRLKKILDTSGILKTPYQNSYMIYGPDQIVVYLTTLHFEILIIH
jgi:hypothetical protein